MAFRAFDAAIAGLFACWLFACPLTTLAAEGVVQGTLAGQPLHERIDALIDAAAIGPLAPRCSDADFVRRIYLDLTGAIPTANQARTFVGDPSADKRQRLIDELLSSPAFVRHMTITLDVLLMERKAEKVIKQPEWEKFLYESLAADKPLDRLFQDVLNAEGDDPKTRPAARFTLDRDAEPNLLTRDIGRLAFGMDLQCCQCHDHPLIDAYFQEDYYGLFAFVSRTALFTDTKTKTVSLTEKADGEASFKSVFTGASSDRAQPRLPKGPLLFGEPAFGKGDEYSVKPDKTARGIPRYSRRAALANMLPASREFAVNLANRLWSHLFGRGLVHPLDLHHVDNPPSNAALLSQLADEIGKGFKLRPFLRELALTRAYQRSCDEPRADTLNYIDVAARLTALTSELTDHRQALKPLESSLAAAQAAFKTARENDARIALELSKVNAEIATAREQIEKLAVVRQAGEKRLAAAAAQVAAVESAAASLTSLASLMRDSVSLAESAAALSQQAAKLTTATQKQAASFTEPTADEINAAKRLNDAEQSLAAATADRVSMEILTTLERAYLSARHRCDDAKATAKSLEGRIALAKDIVAYQSLASTADATAPAVWSSLVERWTIASQIAPLKPLTPEQLALGVMQAAGSLSAEARSPGEGPDSQATSQLAMLEKIRPTFREFVRYYGGLPGEEFQATVNQALFFGNGTLLDTWLKPADGNLIGRLEKITEVDVLSNEIYWSVLSRPPSSSERDATASYLKDRTDRAAALAEIMWALLSSTEFRFCH